LSNLEIQEETESYFYFNFFSKTKIFYPKTEKEIFSKTQLKNYHLKDENK